MRLVRATAAGMVLLLGACSFTGVRGPPSPLPVEGPVECTTSRGRAFGDMAASILLLSLSAMMFTNDEGGDIDDLGDYVIGGPMVALGAITTASAIYGHVQVSRCERANEEVANRPRSPISPTAWSATSEIR